MPKCLETPPVKHTSCPFKSQINDTVDPKQTSSRVPYDFWPDKLNLDMLHQNNPLSSPMNADFDYAKEFNTLSLDEVRKDLVSLMTDSQSWWPADFGSYAPFFVRMAWHSAGTYRALDGKGGSGDGTIRFAPLNSWPDNGNLDKARRLLWHIKQKYGQKLSWADLMIFTGNVALETMGFKPLGFGGGRVDVWTPDTTYWGSETKMLENKERYSSSKKNKKLEKPLAATNMGLIYVNPEGPNGNPDPVAAAHDIRTAFRRMGMNDEETVALIAGGHSFGKCHGAASTKYVGPEPEAAPIHQMGFGWKNSFGSGNARDTITSGLEVTWTTTPTKFSMDYLEHLFEYDWKLVKSPAGAHQWIATKAKREIPDAHDPNKKHKPTMLTTDLSLRLDKKYRKISKIYLENPDQFADAFAKAWFKLTHRDMGPVHRYLGPDVPKKEFIWQDPVPIMNHPLISEPDINNLKMEINKSELTRYELIMTAWNSASSFRQSDYRGGSHGARIQLDPQRFWPSNQPEQLSKVLPKLKLIQSEFNNSKTDGTKVSLADLIVLGGAVGIEQAAVLGGKMITVPFTPGRMDATQEQTDVDSFNLLKPTFDGFINYLDDDESNALPEQMLVLKAEQLGLTAPQMTVMVGGLRSMGINYNKTPYGVLTDRPNALTPDFFKNILDIDITWKQSRKNKNKFKGIERTTGVLKWKATRVDLIFGSQSVLRAYSEVYASHDAEPKFYQDFIKAWNIVMNANHPLIK